VSTQTCPSISNNLTHIRKNSLTWNRIKNHRQVFFLQGQSFWGIGRIFLSTIPKGLFQDPMWLKKDIFQSEHGKYRDIVKK
jgi:hypothetical protein